METFQDVKKPLKKILKALSGDKSKFIKVYYPSDKKITARNLEIAACNHLFDDHPELFGISEFEGHVIRAYFHFRGYHYGRDYIEDLHKAFPEYMEPEEQFYIDMTNKEREKEGLPPLKF